jgi:hypothetical protein
VQGAGAEQAKQRVEAARGAMSEHYRQLREALTQQRCEMEESQSLFQRQKDEFREERQQMTDWMAEHDEALRGREQGLQGEVNALEDREAAWHSVRDQWIQEKIEAEAVIQNLLRQLTDLTTCKEDEPSLPKPAPKPKEMLATQQSNGQPTEPITEAVTESTDVELGHAAAMTEVVGEPTNDKATDDERLGLSSIDVTPGTLDTADDDEPREQT